MGVELYKGRFFCPDHRGSPKEIEAKIPFVDILATIGLPELSPFGEEGSRDAIRVEITREYLRRVKEKANYSVRFPGEREFSRKEVRLRYG